MIFSLLDGMMEQLKPLNVSYLTILDNYPQYENVTKVNVTADYSATMVKGIIESD